jgi:hypothetical protein
MGKRSRRIRELIGRFGLPMLCLAISTACTAPQSLARAENRLFSPAHSRGKIDEAMTSRILRHRFVDVDLRPLAAAESGTATSAAVVLNLFDDAAFRAVLDERENRSGDSFTWIGHIPGFANSQVTLVVDNGIMSGNIRLDRRFYQIRYAGEGTHVVYEVDPDAFPTEGKPLPGAGSRK